MKHVNFYQLPINCFFVHKKELYKKINNEQSIKISTNTKIPFQIHEGCVIDELTYSLLQDKTLIPVKDIDLLLFIDNVERVINSNKVENIIAVRKQPDAPNPEVASINTPPPHAPESKTVFGDIAERYAKSGGVPIKKRYSDEIKEREQRTP